MQKMRHLNAVVNVHTVRPALQNERHSLQIKIHQKGQFLHFLLKITGKNTHLHDDVIAAPGPPADALRISNRRGLFNERPQRVRCDRHPDATVDPTGGAGLRGVADQHAPVRRHRCPWRRDPTAVPPSLHASWNYDAMIRPVGEAVWAGEDPHFRRVARGVVEAGVVDDVTIPTPENML